MTARDETELAARAVVFVDSNVPDVSALLAGLKPGETAFVLDPASDGVQQIASILKQNDLTDLSSISIVGHGAAGEIDVGSTTLNDDDLASDATALAGIGASLAPGGDIALYSCDVAEGAAGQQFITNLSAYTGGAEVAAATHLVGAESGGGSWSLDATAGRSSSAVAAPFTAQTLASYQGELGASTFKLNGVNYVADIYGSYANANSLPQAVAANVNAVAVVTDFGIDAVDDKVYDNDVPGGFTETDEDIGSTIADAAGLGLNVMVRPLIDFLPADYDDDPNPAKNGAYYNNEWRTYFNPGAAGSAGADEFFASYQSMIVGEAKLAQADGASILCIGTELDQITGPAYEKYWDNIITAVKGVFSGQLTYSADWDDAESPWQYGNSGLAAGTGDITTQISFWNKLNYVGIDEYAPISNSADPSVDELVDGWTMTPTDDETLDVTGGESLIDYYQGISAALGGEKLLFTEIGYANSSDADSSPATPGYDEQGDDDHAGADPSLQDDLYAAFYKAWSEDGNGSLAGAYLWNWEPSGGGSPFAAQDQPTESTVTAGFGAGDAPAVNSITITGSSPNDASSETFAVTFSEAVNGVSASDFTVATTNTSGGTPLTTGAIEVSGSGATYDVTISDVAGDGTLALYFKANSASVVDGSGNSATAGYTSGETYTIDDPPCYVRGTRILTDRGEIAVEDLRIGDLAVTASGRRRPIVWIGHRTIDVARHPRPAAVRPVRVSTGAFGEGLPRRDLRLSPGHNVACEGALMPISALANGLSVAQVEQAEVEYWHVELDAHDLLLAENLPAESYLDCGNRTAFFNGGAFIEAHPDFAAKHWAATCLPLVKGGPAVARAKALLLARLVETGHEIVREAEAHLVVDGVRVEPTRICENRLAFALAEGARNISLHSQAFIPAYLVAESSDVRQLGLCVGELRVDGETLALDDDETYGSGWHAAEFEGGRFARRWTTGATPLSAGARDIIVELAGLGFYYRQPTNDEARRARA